MLRNFLLVEDNGADAHLVERAIVSNQLTAQMDWIKDGEIALDIILNRPNSDWSLILLDIMLPKVTGLQLLEHLKTADKIKELPPIVVFSSSSQEVDINRALEAGAAAYFTKPNSYLQMKTIIKEIFLEWMKTT